MTNINEKAIKAAERFLSRKGMEIIDTNWSAPDGSGEIGIVANDDDTLVFVEVSAKDSNGGFPTSGDDRAKQESLSACWLSEHIADIEGDITIRFDEVAMLIVAPDRALLRHHINRFGSLAAA